MDQRPKQSETHSSTFPQDSDSGSESEIELRSTQTSPETTTSEESDGTLVDTSTSTTPTPSLLGEGDLDSTEGHSQLSVGILPLTDKDPPEKPQEKDPHPGSSEIEGPNPTSSKDTSNNPPSPRDKETVTTPPPKDLEHVVGNPPSPHRKDSPTEYPPTGNPKAPLDSEEGLGIPPAKKSQSVPPDDPFSRFWSGQTADTSDKNKKRYRWLDRKPERRYSVKLEALDEQDHRPFRYVLRRERSLLPRPKFYSKCPDAEGVSLEYVGFILQHIVWQRLREQGEVDPIISPFDSGEDETPGEDTHIPPWAPKCPSTSDIVSRDTL